MRGEWASGEGASETLGRALWGRVGEEGGVSVRRSRHVVCSVGRGASQQCRSVCSGM